MKAYLGKILICVVPVAIACVIVGWAFHQYSEGKGGFRFGVDLVGGTILVYQVDPTKPGANSEKLDELAAALKRRIDPNDLYNVTIRPVPGDPPRVEIILPTGGRHQIEAEQRAWDKLVEAARAEYPVEGKPDAYADIRQGAIVALTNAIKDAHPKADVKEVSA